MMKTPLWGNALLILSTHLEHETLNRNQLYRKEASTDAHKGDPLLGEIYADTAGSGGVFPHQRKEDVPNRR